MREIKRKCRCIYLMARGPMTKSSDVTIYDMPSLKIPSQGIMKGLMKNEREEEANSHFHVNLVFPSYCLCSFKNASLDKIQKTWVRIISLSLSLYKTCGSCFATLDVVRSGCTFSLCLVASRYQRWVAATFRVKCNELSLLNHLSLCEPSQSELSGLFHERSAASNLNLRDTSCRKCDYVSLWGAPFFVYFL